MIRSIRRGATREELGADLTRMEALEDDPGWDVARESAADYLRYRVASLDRRCRTVELRPEDIQLDPSIAD